MGKNLITFKKMKHDTLLHILKAMSLDFQTKREIQRSTGISWGTCSESINFLEQMGLISRYSTNGGGKPGPRSSRYGFSRERFLIMGIEVAVEGLSITLSSQNGKVIRIKEYLHGIVLGNDNAVSMIESRIREFLKEFSLSEKSVYTLQFALTGALDRNNLIWLQTPKHHKIQSLDFNTFYHLFPHVRAVNLVHDIQARATDIQHRLEIDNSSYVMLHIADGVGMAAKEKNQFIQGNRGLAGEIGHIPYFGESLLSDTGCFCGQKNCIEHDLHYQKILDYYNSYAPEEVDNLTDVDRNSAVYEDLYRHIQNILLNLCRILVDIFDCSGLVIGGKSIAPWQERLESEFLPLLRTRTWQQGPGDIAWYYDQDVSPSRGACLMNRQVIYSKILRLEINDI